MIFLKKVTIDLDFETAKHGHGGGLPILKTFWEHFGFSQLFADIDKHSGTPPWKMAFAYIAGLVANSQSVNGIAKNDKNSPVLEQILSDKPPSQSAFSRFFKHDLAWLDRSIERLKAFCSTPETVFAEGDVIALDDTKIEHPYGKKMPFLCWLFDNAEKKHLWCMNLVSTLLIRSNGLVTPLLWRIWVQDKSVPKPERRTKFVLAEELLLNIRSLTTVRLWVAMDRWFLSKDFFKWLVSHQFDWVTKAKRNTALFIQSGEDWKGTPRYVSVNPSKLIAQVYPELLKTGKPKECVAVSIPGVYIKLPMPGKTKKGKDKTIQVMTRVAAIATIRLPEDIETTKATLDTAEPDEKAARYKGAYLLLSNRYDAPDQAIDAYAKRWKIEIFYRNAKQELGLTACHAQTKEAHEGHIEMIFTAETLLNYAHWQLNAEKSEGAEILVTHGQMVREIINASHRICCLDKIHLYCDMASSIFSSFMRKFWPDDCRLGLGKMIGKRDYLDCTA